MTKLLDYAKVLAKQGESLEKEGDNEEAIPRYIKVVDILLLLAESAPTYPEWMNYVSKAEYYQKRTKIALAKIAMYRKEENEVPKQITKSEATSTAIAPSTSIS